MATYAASETRVSQRSSVWEAYLREGSERINKRAQEQCMRNHKGQEIHLKGAFITAYN